MWGRFAGDFGAFARAGADVRAIGIPSMRCTITVCVLLACALSAQRVQGWDDTATTTSIIKYSDDAPPVREIAAKGKREIQAFVYAPDGKSIYLLVQDFAINIWGNAVYFWPEILGGVTGALIFVSLNSIRRIYRHPRIAGEPYCEKCNYCLRENTSDRCPECGLSPLRIEVGRPMARRMRGTIALTCLCVLGYGSLWAARVPRTGWFGNYFEWWSCGAGHWAEENNFRWVLKCCQFISKVVEVEVSSGREIRTIFFAKDHSTAWLYGERELLLAGTHLAFQLNNPERWILLDVASGRQTACVTAADLPKGSFSDLGDIVGFDNTGEVLFATALDKAQSKARLIAWRIATRSLISLFESDATPYFVSSGAASFRVHHWYIPNSSPPQFIEFRRQHGGPIAKSMNIRNSAHPTNQIPFPVHAFDLSRFARPLLSRDGHFCYAITRHPSDWHLSEIDLRSMVENKIAQGVEELSSPYSIYSACATEDGRLIIHGTFEVRRNGELFNSNKVKVEGLLVFDRQSLKWRDLIPLPASWMSLGMSNSPDGQSFAILGLPTVPKQVQRYSRLYTYNFADLPKQLDMNKFFSNPSKSQKD
jgi:hypothetical protein